MPQYWGELTALGVKALFGAPAAVAQLAGGGFTVVVENCGKKLEEVGPCGRSRGGGIKKGVKQV